MKRLQMRSFLLGVNQETAQSPDPFEQRSGLSHRSDRAHSRCAECMGNPWESQSRGRVNFCDLSWMAMGIIRHIGG